MGQGAAGQWQPGDGVAPSGHRCTKPRSDFIQDSEFGCLPLYVGALGAMLIYSFGTSQMRRRKKRLLEAFLALTPFEAL